MRPNDADDWGVVNLLDDVKVAFRNARQLGRERVAEMAGRVAALERALHDTEKMAVTADRRAARLTDLYVAAYQLHCSFDPADVHLAIFELATNLLGAASCVLLFADGDDTPGYAVARPAGQTAPPIFDAGRYDHGDLLVDECLQDGGLRFGPALGSSVRAAVPLTVHGETAGAIVVCELLPHKARLGPDDHGLMDLLGAHAACALVTAHAVHTSQRKLRTLEGLLTLMRRSM
jgi:hypothetical protein